MGKRWTRHNLVRRVRSSKKFLSFDHFVQMNTCTNFFLGFSQFFYLKKKIKKIKIPCTPLCCYWSLATWPMAFIFFIQSIIIQGCYHSTGIAHLKVHFVIHSLIPPFFSKEVEIFSSAEAFRYIMFVYKIFIANSICLAK